MNPEEQKKLAEENRIRQEIAPTQRVEREYALKAVEARRRRNRAERLRNEVTHRLGPQRSDPIQIPAASLPIEQERRHTILPPIRQPLILTNPNILPAIERPPILPTVEEFRLPNIFQPTLEDIHDTVSIAVRDADITTLENIYLAYPSFDINFEFGISLIRAVNHYNQNTTIEIRNNYLNVIRFLLNHGAETRFLDYRNFSLPEEMIKELKEQAEKRQKDRATFLERKETQIERSRRLAEEAKEEEFKETPLCPWCHTHPVDSIETNCGSAVHAECFQKIISGSPGSCPYCGNRPPFHLIPLETAQKEGRPIRYHQFGGNLNKYTEMQTALEKAYREYCSFGGMKQTQEILRRKEENEMIKPLIDKEIRNLSEWDCNNIEKRNEYLKKEVIQELIDHLNHEKKEINSNTDLTFEQKKDKLIKVETMYRKAISQKIKEYETKKEEERENCQKN
jgi:hypothetical protein